MHGEPILEKLQKEWHGTLNAYLIGFFLSLFLTSLSFYLVINHSFEGSTLIYALIGLGVLQAIGQLIFFLHIGQEKKPHFGVIALAFTVLILLIVMIGSIWIMHDLNKRVMNMPKMNMETTK